MRKPFNRKFHRRVAAVHIVPDRDRLASAAAVAVLHLALGWALLSGLGVGLVRRPEKALDVFQVAPEPPPPSPPPPREEPAPAPARAERPKGEAALPNLRAVPKPVVAPPPVIPPPQPVPAAPIAGVGPDTSAGAAERPGPGMGAGGAGEGLGAGGRGSGTGGGGSGEPARYLSGRLRNSDYPAAAVRVRAEGVVVVALDIDERGRVAGCRVAESSGNADLDATTCRLIRKRFRYAPARDASGRPAPDMRGWRQTWWLARP